MPIRFYSKIRRMAMAVFQITWSPLIKIISHILLAKSGFKILAKRVIYHSNKYDSGLILKF